MSSTISGGITTACTVTQQLASGANIINPYNVPLSVTQSAQYTTGTGPNQAAKGAQLAGTCSVTQDIDLTTIVCADTSVGFSHVREFVIFNLDPANPLTVGNDGVVSYPWQPWALGTSPRIIVPAGGNFRITQPLGATGLPVTAGSSCRVRLNPGTNAVPYEVIVLGD